MADLTGVLSTQDGNQGSRIYDISRDWNILSPFQPLVMNLAFEKLASSHDVRYQWDELDYTAAKTQINFAAGYLPGDVTFVVDDGTVFTVNDLIRNLRTEENYQVTATGATSITVLRNIGASGAVALLDNDVLLNIGSAYAEGSTAGLARTSNTSTVYNFAQIFRRPYSVTGSKDRTMSTPAMGFGDLASRAMDEFKRDVEYGFIFGRREEDTTNFSEVRHATGGITDYVTTNVTDKASATITETEWTTFLSEQAFIKGESTKLALCGNKIFEALSLWGRSYGQVRFGVNGLGFSASEYTAPTGETLLLVSHELFKGDPTLAGMCMVLDMSEIRARFTENPSTGVNGNIQVKENIQNNSSDTRTDEFFGELGFEIHNEQKHAILKGVTGGA